MNECLVGVYKEVGKNPDIIKIKNQKEYIEKLLDGEYTKHDYDSYTILYKKDSDNLLANIYVEQYLKIGISLKGKIFAVGKDENGNLISLTKEQAKKCISFFLEEAFDYTNFDEYGRYISNSKRSKKINMLNKNNPNNISYKDDFNTVKNDKLSDEETLDMILKIVFTILNFVKKSTDNIDNE